MCALPSVYLPTREPIAVSAENLTVPSVWREFFKTVQASIQGPIDLSDITLFAGILPFSLGGTGSSAAPTAGGIAYGTGTALAWTAAGSEGQVWVAHGASGPTPSDLFTAVTVSTTGNITFLNPAGAALVRMTNSSLATIQGVIPTYSGQLLEVVSAGSGDVVIADESSGAFTAASRLNTNGFGDVRLPAGQGRAWAVYDNTTQRWRVLGWTPPTAVYRAIVTILAAASPYTLLPSDGTVLANATSGAITVNLPAVASALPGRCVWVKKIDASANAVTVAANGSEKIDGAASVSLGAQYALTRIQADSTGWWVV